jgi:hypothetical protein
LKHFHATLPQAQAEVEKSTEGLSEDQQKQIAKRVGVDWHSDAAQKRIAELKDQLLRAHALMQEAVDDAAGK